MQEIWEIKRNREKLYSGTGWNITVAMAGGLMGVDGMMRLSILPAAPPWQTAVVYARAWNEEGLQGIEGSGY